MTPTAEEELSPRKKKDNEKEMNSRCVLCPLLCECINF